MAGPAAPFDPDADRRTPPTAVPGARALRRDALIDGLAAEAAAGAGEDGSLAASIDELNALFTPDHVVEADLVRRAAVASTRLRRCEAAREAAVSPLARAALARYDSRRRHAVRKRAQQLAIDPARTVASLERSAFGCDWLLRHWEALDAPLALGQRWDRPRVDQALRLLGIRPDPDGTDPEVIRLRELALAAGPDSPGSSSSSPARAMAELRRLVAEEVADLRRLRLALWEHVDAPAREAARLAALADTDDASRTAHRLEREAELSYHRNVAMIIRVRTEARRAAEAARAEARAATIPRSPVGGGWWAEPDASPAPPGFRRIALITEPDDPGPPASPRPEPADPPGGFDPKADPYDLLRRIAPGPAAGAPGRTPAHPIPIRPAPEPGTEAHALAEQRRRRAIDRLGLTNRPSSLLGTEAPPDCDPEPTPQAEATPIVPAAGPAPPIEPPPPSRDPRDVPDPPAVPPKNPPRPRAGRDRLSLLNPLGSDDLRHLSILRTAPDARRTPAHPRAPLPPNSPASDGRTPDAERARSSRPARDQGSDH